MTPTEIAEMQADALAGTPGPWVHDDKSRPFHAYSDDATGSIVATVDGFRYAPRPYDEKRANARRIARVPRLEATVTAQAAEIARLKDAVGILEDALQEAGDDYPGSSMQGWCQQQVKAARAALEAGE